MKKGKKPETWFVLADAGKSRLLRCTVAPVDRCHVEEFERIESDWEGHEHGRPSPRAAKSGTTYASQGHENEEDVLRFARQVATWLEGQVESREIERLTLFAPSTFLGAFRKICPTRLTAMIDEEQGGLTGLDNGALSKHPSIRRLMPGAEG